MKKVVDDSSSFWCRCLTRTDIARLPLRQLSFFFVVLTGVDLKFVFMF